MYVLLCLILKYIKCSLDEVAEMVAAANDKDGDNLF